MKKIIEIFFGRKLGKTRVVPVTSKILIVFVLMILISNLSSNYINLIFNRAELVSQMKELLGKDLRDINSFVNNQYEIYQLTKNKNDSLESIEKKGSHELKNPKSVVFGVEKNAGILFQAGKVKKISSFKDTKSLETMTKNLDEGVTQGFLPIQFNNSRYFAVYKYNENWQTFIIRAEEEQEFFKKQRTIFRNVSIIIFLITLVSAIVGIYLLRYILRFVPVITRNIMHMLETQKLELIDLKGATNDDITFLGAAFNALSSTVNNLLGIFRKFANKDIVIKAYRDREVKLEGVQRELTVLFSDIKSFTFITETLGTDIIRLLNMHYDRAIREVLDHDGLIGAIIGDALLSVYGALDDLEGQHDNKSLQAILSGYKIHDVAASLREEMQQIRDDLEKENGHLSEEEEKVYQACLIEVGVGIDGGEVFYGTIGSYMRMTNTVIGDRVNSASRLEGLTRVYKLPVICSEYAKLDVEENVDGSPIVFVEIDTVQVKGKTEGRPVYWPVLSKDIDDSLEAEIEIFSKALQQYYDGEWSKAHRGFSKSKLPMSEVFKERTKTKRKPAKWNGIWQMTTK